MTYIEKCPHIKTVSAGDESIDLCNINDKVCLLESGDKCTTYKEWLDELQAEETAEIESQMAQEEARDMEEFEAQQALDKEAAERNTLLLDSPFTCVSGDIERDNSDTIEPPA